MRFSLQWLELVEISRVLLEFCVELVEISWVLLRILVERMAFVEIDDVTRVSDQKFGGKKSNME